MFTVPAGFTRTVPVGISSDVVLVGPITTTITQDTLTFVDIGHIANATPTNVPQIWDPEPFFSGYNTSVLANLSSFISFGREPACTSAFSSFAAANPTTVITAVHATTFTLTNGQSTVAIAYSTMSLAMTSQPHCCGICSLYFTHLEMLYFPAPHPNTACLEGATTVLNNTASVSSIAAQQETSTLSDPYTVVTDTDGNV